MALFLTEDEVTQLLPMPAAMACVEACFRQLGEGRATNLPRRRAHAPPSSLHVMFAALPEERWLGLKAYVVGPAGAQFHVLLYDADAGRLLALIQANRLGQRRTGAASGIATRYLAREDARIHLVIGTGWQAEAQVEAIALARPAAEVHCFSRDPERRRRFAERMAAQIDRPILAVDDLRAAVESADIVTTITTAREPLFAGDWLRAGAHLNVAGSNSLLKREIDLRTVERAGLIVVDDRDAVPLEGGDLLAALETGRLAPEALVELGEVVAGRHRGRINGVQITLFKSHGIALEDVAVAGYVYRVAREQGVGRELPL